MATELQSLLRRALDALGESCGRKQVTNGSPVLTGAASRVQNALHLAPEIELDAWTGWLVAVDGDNQIMREGWDPREQVPDATIWRADWGVTTDANGVATWRAWWPIVPNDSTLAYASAHNPPVTTRPTFAEDVFGRGSREWPGPMVYLPPGDMVESFMMRNPDQVSADLNMGTGAVHTMVFWVHPDVHWLKDAGEDMPIICQWGGSQTAKFWLGITGDGEFVYKVSPNGEYNNLTTVTSSIQIDLDEPELMWYRVAARFDAANGLIAIGVAEIGDELTWTSEEFAGPIHGAQDVPLYVGGCAMYTAEKQRFKGRMSHGYYHSATLTDEEVESLSKNSHTQPVGYEELMADTTRPDILRTSLVSCWQFDEPSRGYCYDKHGKNNLHWGFWWVGCAPGVGQSGFPAIRFTRTLVPDQGGYTEQSHQYFSCDSLATSLSDSSNQQDPNYPHRRMTLIALLRPASYTVSGHPHGLVSLSDAGSAYPYRMWRLTSVYHRDGSQSHNDAVATINTAREEEIEDTTQDTYGGPDQSAHVMCTVWAPTESYAYAVTLYVDDPVTPYEDPHDLTGSVEPITFNRFGFGAIRRSGAEVFQPFDGYLGMLIVVPRAVSDEERVFLMQWVKHTAGLVPEAF